MIRTYKFSTAALIFLFVLPVCRATPEIHIERLKLGEWRLPAGVEESTFELGMDKGHLRTWGHRRGAYYREFFVEFLPAIFERTLALDQLDLKDGRVEWLFTGENGGFTVSIGPEDVGFHQRHWDSFAFEKIDKEQSQQHRHPEWRPPAKTIKYTGSLHAVTVTLDYKLAVEVALNGQRVLREDFFSDVSRHQLNMTGHESVIKGKMLTPRAESGLVRVYPSRRGQKIIGFGGITTPTAYARLSPEGKRQWWKYLCEYNLLIQREYPIGTRLNESMDNWDRLADAMPHYYGNNFPNGEIVDFDYLRTLRKLGGKVWFEFWRLPPWVGNDVNKYAKAMVNYCQTSKERIGSPPDVLGIQNEKRQSEEMWHKMTLVLRRKLDEAGFKSVEIHMSDDSRLKSGLERAKAFRSSKEVWDIINYSAVHMYDYQNFFADPDGYDGLLKEWNKLTGDKPFLSTELCINSDKYQLSSYRIALPMAQLYHKNLVLADAAAICYCWTLLNVVQPSYGYTRSLFVPDPAHGFLPAPSSFQLRTFGAYSRRIREGMVRVDAETDLDDLLVSAFSGKQAQTLVILNRAARPRRVHIQWFGVQFLEIELADPYNENTVRDAPSLGAGGLTEVTVQPGAIMTLTNAPLGKVSDDVISPVLIQTRRR